MTDEIRRTFGAHADLSNGEPTAELEDPAIREERPRLGLAQEIE